MAKHVETVSSEGFASTSEAGSYDIALDPTGETAPDTLESLLATYAACYIPALRVAAEQRDAGDLGRVHIAVTGELNDDDKLAAVDFAVTVDATLDESKASAVVERANALCKVHDALKPALHASVDVNSSA